MMSEDERGCMRMRGDPTACIALCIIMSILSRLVRTSRRDVLYVPGQAAMHVPVGPCPVK